MKIIILRGISGSGKSLLAKELAQIYNDKFRDEENYPKARILSADNYFMKDGKYLFDARLLPRAHSQCLRDFMASFRINPPELCIIDNTNTSVIEVAPYYAIANAHKATVKLVTLMCDPAIAWESNQHGVSSAIILRQHQRLLNESLPPWWSHEVAFRIEPTDPETSGLCFDPQALLESME